MSEYDDLLAQVRSGEGTPSKGANEYDQLLTQVRGDSTAAVQSSLYNASFVNPVEAAGRLDVANKLKTYLGEDWAPGIVDPVEAQRRLRIAENDHVLRNSPALSRKFIESGYAERTFDDVKQLAEVERIITDSVHGRLRPSEGPMASVSALFAGLGVGFTQGAERARQGIRMQFADMIGSGAMQADAMEKRAQASFRENLATPEIEDPTLRGIYSGVQSTLAQLPGIAAAILTRNPSVALGSMGVQVEADAYGKYRERGGTALEALAGGVGEGGVEVLTEMIPMGFMVKQFGKVGAGDFIKGLLGREVWTEQIATAAQDAIDTAIANPDKTWGEYLAERPDAAYQTLVATVTQASIMGGANALATYPKREELKFQRDARQAERAMQAEQTLTQLVDAVAQTQSIQRNPQDVADLLAEADEDGASEVFINARQFANVFNQDAVPQAERLGIDAQTLNDALTSNSDLTVPLATMTITVAQDQALRPLLEHARVDPGDMSPAEARLWQSSQGEAFKAEAEAVLAKRQADAVYQGEVESVHQALLGELNAAGRFAPQVNQKYASMVRDFYVTMADRAGMSVTEMAARYPLRVRAEGVGGLAQGDVGPFGTVLTDYQGDARGAIAKLTEMQGGEAIGALQHPDIGNIDLVWGEAGTGASDGYGLAKLLKWHPEVVDNLQEILSSMQVVSRSANRVNLESADHRAGVRLTYDNRSKNWLLTAFKKKEGGVADTRTDTTDIGGEGDTARLSDASDDIVDRKLGEFYQAAYNQSRKAKRDDQTLDIFGDQGEATPAEPAQPSVPGDVQPAETVPRGTYASRTELVQEGERRLGTSTVSTIEEAAQAMAYLGKGAVERFDALVTDAQGKPLGIVGAFKGALAQASVFPATVVGEAFRIPGAANIWFAHNHPSGLAKFSNADRNINRALTDAFQGSSITPRGLFAIGSGAEGVREWVHTEGGGDTTGQVSVKDGGEVGVPLMERIYVKTDKLAPAISSPTDAKQLAESLSGGESGMLLLDSQNAPVAFVPLAPDDITTLRGNGKMDAIYRALSVANAGAAIIVNHSDTYTPDQVYNLTGLLGSLDVRPLDVIGTGQGAAWSWAEKGRSISKGNSFMQGERGFFNPDTNTIGLLENADLSTFLHESGHFFLEVMADMATRPDAAPAIRADFDALLNWFGVTGTPEADAATTWHLMSLEEKRQFHEQFARGFEAYLFEGKAPSVEMQGLFRRFRQWLSKVYQSLKELNVTLTDDVRGVFDRMIASEEAIKTAEAVRNLAPIFQTPEQAGMTAEEWAQYQAEGQQASDNAVDELQARSLRDMRWQANAKIKAIKRLQVMAKEVRADVMMDVRREVLSEPIYQAWQFLTGKNPDKIAKIERGDPAAINPAKDTLLVAIAKMGGIDREQAIKEWGMDPKDDTKAENPGGKTIVARKGGMSIDDMRLALEEWGYLPDSSDPDTDPKAFEELFFDALAGGEHYSAWGEEAMIAAEMRNGQRDPEEGITLENTPAGKLNTDQLRAMYGEEATAPWRLLSALRMTSPDGFSPDMVANLFGFGSGDELVRRLAVAEDPKIVIEAMTDQRMLEQHGDLSSKADIERAAERAIHNDVRARVLTRELNALRKATGQGDIMLKAARLHAENWLARQTVKNATRHSQHAAAEARSGKAAFDTLAKGDTKGAATHKRDQLLNNQLARAALRAQDEVEKAVRYLKKFDKAGTRKALDQQYLDQIDQLLERFDLRQVTGKALQKRASLRAWLDEQEAAGLDPVIDGRLVEDAQRQHFSTLTLEEFRGLVDSVKSIEHVGRLKHRLLTAKDKREFAKVVTELSESVVDNANRDVTTVNAITPLEKGAKLLRGFSAMHRKFASLMREMDGGKDGGPMWEYLVRSMNSAGDAEVSLRGAMSERFAAVFAGLKGIKLNEKVFVPELNISLRREELLSIALNSGNEGNLQRLMDGGINDSLRAVSAKQLMGLLNRLSNQEWDFVEGVWSMIAINRPAIAAQEKMLTGVEPKWVEPSPFTLQSGRVIMGGYYPAKYNADMSTRSNELEAITDLRQQMQGAGGRASTRNGYAKERAEAVAGRPLRLDLGVIAQHINEVTHRLSWQAWLIDARRLIAAPALDRAVRDHYGPEILAQMKKQLADIAAGDNGPTDAMDKVMNHLRNGTTIAGMGWNIMTSLMQPIGITQSIERVGAGWIAKGLGQFVVSPFEATKDVHERSSFMRDRAKTINREINDVLNTIRSERMTKVEGSYFYLIQKFQQMVDVPTWLGAYEKAVAEGNAEDRASALADQAVIDSQGGGTIKDLSAIQRGGAGQKLFTNFYSFFNTTYQRAVENYRVTEFTNPLMIGRLAANYLLLFTVPVVWGWALKEALRGDDDEEDAEEIARRLAMEQINYLLGTMVLAREIGSAVSGFAGYQGPAGTRFFSEVAKLTKQIGQGDVDGALVKAAANTVGVAANLPSGQVVKSVDGLVQYIDGNAGPQAVLVGPPLRN